MARQTRIGPDGNVIKDGDDEGASGSGGSRRRFRLPSYVDVFGFHLELKHFAVLFVFVLLTMGGVGGELKRSESAVQYLPLAECCRAHFFLWSTITSQQRTEF